MLLNLHQLEAADEALQMAVTLDPYHRGGWYQLGHVAFEQREYRKAIRWYTRQREVIASSPPRLKDYYRRIDETALPQTWLQVGRAYELLQVADSARWAYERVIALDSTHAQANAWLSGLYDAEGDTEHALRYMRRAWRSKTGDPEFAYELGTLLFKAGALGEALPLFEHTVAAQPWNAGAHYNLGRTLTALGRAEEGRRHLEVTDELQDLDQAIESARAAVAQFPDEPARWRGLAELLGRAGRDAERHQTHQIIRALNLYADSGAISAAQ
jgi:tetratricopeptide (TPR) repeat protein